jgi:flagellar hook-associated protein 1 FlgK
MPSLGSILSIAASGLRTQQRAMEVTSHNLANVNTEGYARQRAELSALTPLRTPEGNFGTGVGIADVTRVADRYAESGLRSETALLGRHEARGTLLERVEGALNEPGEEGLGAALDRFFSAWSELSVEPGNRVARATVLDTGQRVVEELHRIDGQIEIVRTEAEARLTTGVEEVNALAGEVAQLNRRIVAAEAAGNTAGDLRDAQGRALARLSELVPVTVLEQENGSVGVVVEGDRLVDGTSVRELTAFVSGSRLELRVGDSGVVAKLGGGALRGFQDVVNEDLPAWRGELDDLAAALVDEVNTLHRTGTNRAGATGVDFFDPTGITAGSVALDVAVAGDTDALAAGTGTSDTPPAYRPGAADVALELAGLRSTSISALGATFGDHLGELAADTGARVRRADESAQVHRTLVDQWTVRRESVSGVSVDEELLQLVKFQSAYAASARVVTTADEMLATLLAM